MDSSKMGGIRVKDIAKINSTSAAQVVQQAEDSNQSADDVRSLPSIANDFVSVPRLRSSSKAGSTPLKRRRSSIPESYTPKRKRVKKLNQETPSTGTKISDYFKPTPKTETPTPSTSKTITPMSPESQNSSEMKENGRKRVAKPPEPRVERVRRKLCQNTNLKLVSNRYFDDNQSRVSNFYEKTKTNDFGYHTVVKSSKQPVIIDGGIDVEDFLDVDVLEQSHIVQLNGENEEKPDLVTLERLHNPTMDDDELEREAWNMEEKVIAVQNLSQAETTLNDEPEPMQTPIMGRKARKRGPDRKIVCPKYKVIAGTTFAVDAFRFGKIDGITHYFLTHFHADHHIGLTKTFDMPLICSPITARLAQGMIKVESKFILTISVHETITINGVQITAIDANHCPGALMFFFKLPNGMTALHTGDFRANPEMESLPIFWNNDVTEIYLDTTYLSSKTDMAPQSECITRCLEDTRTYFEKHIGDKILVVVGSYLIGKEKVWAAIAEQFKLKVWAEAKRRQALQAVGDPQLLKFLVDDPREAGLHVVNMGILGYDDVKSYLSNFPDIFTHVLAFRPSGWSKNQRPRHQGNISIIGVDYSEHSSYSELRRFVSYLRPKTIISTVPTSKDPNKCPKIPVEWYKGAIAPKRDTVQIKIDQVLPVIAPTTSSVSLNPSAIKRRTATNLRVGELEVVDTIVLDSSEDESDKSDETDYMS